ncbi:5'-nucleotidase, lipoprotein e(P4) family [Geminocystis sp. NIES-3709]|uniref:5'-nucleotidase, lipoprotein e(P4) family n=1 Tax=Geminocystis sp. NIES-3709 TaxID=1617448 RepID=UPI0005FC4B2D|nr:5'-nucleotidase, lipoprotein e(P4) family [Geminocystis sp. NIES-3709]BAQ63923.1 outer membrane lipoprotein e [Geminocystis sp. NIES-3709]
MKKIFYPLLALSFLSGTIVHRLPSIAFNEQSNVSQEQLNDQALLGLNWVQQSGEYRALAYQAFNIAKMAFDSAKKERIENPTVIVDLDETILDNSPYQASLIDTNEGFSSKSWNQWILAEETLAVPGAVEFINYVNTNGGKVFFVSNRNESTTKDSANNDLELATMRNMEKLGFQGVTEETLLLKGEFTNDGNTAKQWRMEAVTNKEADGVKRNIVIFMGDNLNDFSEIDKNSNQVRKEFVDRTQLQYGLFTVNSEGFKPAYIVLPNPMYGDWENGLYDAKRFGKNSIWDLNPEQKTILRKESLIKWDNNK